MLHELPASPPAQVQLLRFARVRGWSRAARRLVWAPALALVVLLLQSAFWADRVPLVLKIGIAAVAILAARRPADALLILVGLVPFGHVVVTRIWSVHPLALSEALVLAFLAGYLWHGRRSVTEATQQTDRLGLPAQLFALIVVASCLVQLSVLQVWHDYPLGYARSFVAFLARDYLTSVPDLRPWVDGRRFVSTAALLLESVALLMCAQALCREEPARGRRLTTMIVIAGSAAAALSFFEAAATALRENQSVISVLRQGRWSAAIPSVNTAGSYFLLVAFVALGSALRSRRHFVPASLAVLTLIGAMWITKTRVSIVAGLATAAAVMMWRLAAGRWRLRGARAGVITALVAPIVGTLIVIYNPSQILAPGGRESLELRVLFAETASRMLRAHPWFGVGVGQYALHYPDFSSPELLQYYTRNDAHNYFLWLGAEDGLIGLGAFMWLLAAALSPTWARLREHPSDTCYLSLVAGIVAFVITWVIGQPLAVPQVAYTFWIVLGVTVGLARVPTENAVADESNGQSAFAQGKSEGHSRVWSVLHHRRAFATPAVWLAALGILASVPVRAARVIDDIDLSRVSYGLYDWEQDAERRRFRWSGPRATIFLKSSVRVVELPVAAQLEGALEGMTVEIAVDRHVVRKMTLVDEHWYPVKLQTPNSGREFWRIDLRVTPTWVPELVLPDTQDDRELGVLVGEVNVLLQEPSSTGVR